MRTNKIITSTIWKNGFILIISYFVLVKLLKQDGTDIWKLVWNLLYLQ